MMSDKFEKEFEHFYNSKKYDKLEGNAEDAVNERLHEQLLDMGREAFKAGWIAASADPEEYYALLGIATDKDSNAPEVLNFPSPKSSD